MARPKKEKDHGIDPSALAAARRELARAGGHARAASQTPEQRRELAKKAVAARELKRKSHAKANKTKA